MLNYLLGNFLFFIFFNFTFILCFIVDADTADQRSPHKAEESVSVPVQESTDPESRREGGV